MDQKDEFTKLSVKQEVKHEIDIIAATERRFVYEVVEDMLKLYKAVTGKPSKVSKSPKSRNGKNDKPMADMTSKYPTKSLSPT